MMFRLSVTMLALVIASSQVHAHSSMTRPENFTPNTCRQGDGQSCDGPCDLSSFSWGGANYVPPGIDRPEWDTSPSRPAATYTRGQQVSIASSRNNHPPVCFRSFSAGFKSRASIRAHLIRDAVLTCHFSFLPIFPSCANFPGWIHASYACAAGQDDVESGASLVACCMVPNPFALLSEGSALTLKPRFFPSLKNRITPSTRSIGAAGEPA